MGSDEDVVPHMVDDQGGSMQKWYCSCFAATGVSSDHQKLVGFQKTLLWV